MNNTTNHTLDGPAFTFTGVRETGLTVKSFFLRTLDLGMATFGSGTRCSATMSGESETIALTYEINAAPGEASESGGPRHGRARTARRRSPSALSACRWSACCAGLLLAATHGVSGGGEIRRSDAPRLVDLVREAQQSVDRLSGQRDALAAQVDATTAAARPTRRWPR